MIQKILKITKIQMMKTLLIHDYSSIDLTNIPDSYMPHLSPQKRSFYWNRLTDEEKLAE